MKLQDLQTDFQQIILSTECVNADWVAETPHGLQALGRLAIYHNAYRIRLIDVLTDTFEHTAIYLGDDWFQQLASGYVESHHSTHNNIGNYGEAFPQFLASELPNDLEVYELAHMDWTLRRAFDGADSPVMKHEHLQKLASGENSVNRLQVVSTLTISTQQFNTLDIWQSINQEETPPVATQLPEPVDLLIWRKGHSPHFRTLPAIESLAIQYIREEYPLEIVGSKLAENFPEIDTATEFGTMLHGWISEEILSLEDPSLD
ncbi:MAG: HvfC/BufC family peptide modification chaperone [bacterium]